MKNTKTFFGLISVFIVIVVGILVWQFLPKSLVPYELIYCTGHSSTVNGISVADGKIIEPDRQGFLVIEAYDYKFYTLDVNNPIPKEVEANTLNKSDLVFSDTHPDGISIEREQQDAGDAIGGLIISNIYLVNQDKKTLIFTEENPTNILRIIGWIKR